MKLKTSWHFTKWDGLNIVLVIQYIPCFKNFAALQIFFYIFLLKWKKKDKNFDPNVFFEAQKFYFVFETRFNFYLLSSGHIHNVVSTLSNVVKIYVKSDNVVSTLSNVVQINVEMDNVDSMLFNVVNFNVNVHSVISTLIWRCATSGHDINLKTTLKRRWNVCWVNMMSNQLLRLG